MFNEPGDSYPWLDALGQPQERDPRCEDCECSTIDRFGGMPTQLCESCADTWDLEFRAGKVFEVSDNDVEG